MRVFAFIAFFAFIAYSGGTCRYAVLRAHRVHFALTTSILAYGASGYMPKPTS
jgi:hypothetical protein